MFPSSVDIKDAEGNSLVTSYALRRPDGNWSIMLVNRDENNPHAIRVQFENARNKENGPFSGPVTMVTFGSEQYVWINHGINSHADPNNPPISITVPAGADSTFLLPKASITVLRGKAVSAN